MKNVSVDHLKALFPMEGDVYLHRVIMDGKVMDEHWFTADATLRRINLWIKQGIKHQTLRIHDGSDTLCRLIYTVGKEG